MFRLAAAASSIAPMIDDVLGELATAMGISVLRNDASCVELSMPVAGNRQPYGILHGGANAVLAEQAASMLAYNARPAGRVAVGSELHINHLQPVKDGKVRAQARFIAAGSSSALIEVSIFNEAGALTAHGQMTAVYVKA